MYRDDRSQPHTKLRGAHALLTVFCASLSCLGYEITLTRFFSISLWYHFAFMVVSIALLGIGAAGAALHLLPGAGSLRRHALYAFLLGLTMPGAALLVRLVPFDPIMISFDWTQILLIGLIAVILSVPFFFFGLIVLSAFSQLTDKGGSVYAADLAGAAVGAIVSLLLLSYSGPGLSVLALAVPPAFSSFLQAKKALRIFAAMLAVGFATGLLISPDLAGPGISPYKPLSLALRFPGAAHLKTSYSPYSRIDLFTGPGARFAPGLSLGYLAPLPRQTGLSIDAGQLSAITHADDEHALEFLDNLPAVLAYHLSKGKDVLVLEPRGGLHVLIAARLGNREITAMESIPHLADVVRNYLREQNVPIKYAKWLNGLGRIMLEKSQARYDVIDLSLTDALPSAGFGFAEDYRYTIEAFRIYIDRLKPDGIITVTLYIIPPPRIELRLLWTLAEAAESLGIEKTKEHIAAIRSWGTVTILFKRSTLSMRDIDIIKDFSKRRRFDTVFYPGLTEEESNIYVKMPDDSYSETFKMLMEPKLRPGLAQAYPFDIKPATDEKPFPHYFLRFERLKEIFRLMGEKWEYFFEEGYLLPGLLLNVSIASILLIFLPVAVKKPQHAAPRKVKAAMFAYFACLGLGFMFVEISLIQKMMLSFETPQHAMSSVLVAVLACSGAGAFFRQRHASLGRPVIPMLLSLIIVLYAFSLPAAVKFLSSVAISYRYPLLVVMIMPMAVLMGSPFPTGIELLAKKYPGLVPLAWAINGCFSVLGPVIAFMTAISSGFSTVMMIAAGLYLSAGLALSVISRSPER